MRKFYVSFVVRFYGSKPAVVVAVVKTKRLREKLFLPKMPVHLKVHVLVL